MEWYDKEGSLPAINPLLQVTSERIYNSHPSSTEDIYVHTYGSDGYPIETKNIYKEPQKNALNQTSTTGKTVFYHIYF